MSDCKEIKDPCEPTPQAGEAWSICLPFGGRVWSDGNGVHVKGGTPPPDGVYGKVVIADGCIIGVEPEEAPLYTGSPCAPLPGDCGGGGSPGVGAGGGGSSGGCCPPSSIAGNLYQLDASGKPYVKVTIKGGSGTSITGSGTVSDPFIITSSGSSGGGIYLTSANDAIVVTGSGARNDPYTLKHKTGVQGTVNGMVFDRYGHLIDKGSGSANKGITGIVGGNGISATTDTASGVTTIGLSKPAQAVAGDYSLGGFKVTVDPYGRLMAVEQEIDLGGWQTVRWGTHDVTINSQGSITSIVDTFNPGMCFAHTWDTGTGGITHAGGTFEMAVSAGITGMLLSTLPLNFWNGLEVYLDDVPCSLGVPNITDGPDSIATNAAALRLIYAPGIIMKGTHKVDVYSRNGPWPDRMGTHIFLWPTTYFTSSDVS